VKRGARAGSLDRQPRGVYRVIGIDGKTYRSSALAILYVTGRYPLVLVDHKNRDTGDDRFENLRVADYSENAFNAVAHRDNRFGLKGVHCHKSGVYRAQIRAHGKRWHLGLFSTPQEAHAAYQAAAKHLHGRFFYGGDNRQA
jgi:AP2 domain